jgi:hypothetical protein
MVNADPHNFCLSGDLRHTPDAQVTKTIADIHCTAGNECYRTVAAVQVWRLFGLNRYTDHSRSGAWTTLKCPDSAHKETVNVSVSVVISINN